MFSMFGADVTQPRSTAQAFDKAAEQLDAATYGHEY
jgi:hypothetical protein